MARPAKFDWDDANTSHIGRHGVTQEESSKLSLAIHSLSSQFKSAAARKGCFALG